MTAHKKLQSSQENQIPGWWIAVRIGVLLLIMFGIVWVVRNSIDPGGVRL